MTLFKEEMKDNKNVVPREFSKYKNEFIWLKGEPEFETQFVQLHDSIPDDI